MEHPWILLSNTVIRLVYQDKNIPYGYNTHINTNDPLFGRILTWYSNSYYKLMLIPNNCKFPISPFGGSLYPISQKEIEEFLKSQTPSDSTTNDED